MKTWYIQIASLVPKRLKTQNLRKLGKVRIVSKIHRIMTKFPVFQKMEILLITAKHILKIQIELFT